MSSDKKTMLYRKNVTPMKLIINFPFSHITVSNASSNGFDIFRNCGQMLQPYGCRKHETMNGEEIEECACNKTNLCNDKSASAISASIIFSSSVTTTVSTTPEAGTSDVSENSEHSSSQNDMSSSLFINKIIMCIILRYFLQINPAFWCLQRWQFTEWPNWICCGNKLCYIWYYNTYMYKSKLTLFYYLMLWAS